MPDNISVEERGQLYAKELGKLIERPTISADLPKLLNLPVDAGPEYFARFRETLEEVFPLVHSNLEIVRVKDDALLFRWKGKSADKPIVLLAHQDVVPAEEGAWKYPPFSGTVADGKIWGRGAMDCKNVIYSSLRAIEELLAEGFIPEYDVYFASSDSEEIAGGGAPAIRDYLKERGVNPFIVLDEGGIIIDKLFAPVKKPFAVIGIVEKGFGVIKFSAKSRGGHTTAPPKNTPFERLARFIVDVHSHSYFKPYFSPELVKTVKALADGVSPPLKFVFKHIRLFAPLVSRMLPKLHPFGGGLLCTNITFTMSGGAIVPNMIPPEAYVVANLRYSAYQTVADCNKLFERLIKKYDLEMEVIAAQDATSTVDTDSDGYRYLTDCIRETFPDIGIAPYIVLGGTDGRHFSEISPCSLRFSPVRLSSEQLATMHGLDENLDISALVESVVFLKRFIQNHK
ncbi:MAG: M20/M25/M40 family metallo-hydrolase [Clostridiaceae bacterium]|jgi:carboxypeptidase PM20D1|nr:M20/M25/M40 family metallo-hydrolase [Clostridiaceae bacterium]